ncbi:phosphocholine-specific phospholipase C [Gluconobacter wancherniae]|uniref:phosphocholine-specific phospholipase C n=1 Tax=Gluconobacter wancherniae TaxID=1307955 RepID=UPI001B8D2EE8|nr:phospholipase C, phosphocholine-specific [Gluconobacter wancherniae]MBS1095056.1 phospholipase C, phosphocholine-specific [Gluconobacter wancherniae]
MSTRRNFLKYALFGGASVAMEGLPGAIQRAYAIAPEPGTTYLDAEHIVVLMQENRSFDHMFGTLAGVRGFNDPRAIRQENGSSVFLQSNKSGETYAPWRLNIHDTKVTWMGSIPHSRDSQVDAWNEGHHDRWVDAKQPHQEAYKKYPLTMGYYTREDLPFYYALADAFTVCDQNYCSVMSSTTPNRLVFWTGTVRDKQINNSNVYMRNPEILEGGMTWTTFPERLEKVGVSWRFYQNEISQTGGLSSIERSWLSNFGCNVLEYFDQFNVSSGEGFEEWINERIKECSNHISKLERLEMLVASTHAEQLIEAKALMKVLSRRQKASRKFEDLTSDERALFKNAFVRNNNDPDYRTLEQITFSDDVNAKNMKAPKGDILYQFREDVKGNRLPTVSWLAAPEHFSDHPTSAWYGAWYVSEVMNILTENPEIWKKTIFILTYDENDGYFDHCASFAAPDPERPETGRSSSSIGSDGLEFTTAQDEMNLGVPEHLARTGPIGLGFRVPMVIASPWSRGGWVNSELFDHSSTLRFIEHFVKKKFGHSTRETNISPWRRAICGDLTSCFRPYDGKMPSLDFLNRNEHLRSIEDARNRPLPGGFHAFSNNEIMHLQSEPEALRQAVCQEAGTRPACAIPYELYCDGGLVDAAGNLHLELRAGKDIHGSRSNGAPFNIYNYQASSQGLQVGTYAVAAGDRITVNVPLTQSESGQYDVVVQAPNGFYRAYKGKIEENILFSSIRNEFKNNKESIVLCLKNGGNVKITIQCEENNSNFFKRVVLSPHSLVELKLDLKSSNRWYDIVLKSEDHPTLMHILGGRVETGFPSSTDPKMAS